MGNEFNRESVRDRHPEIVRMRKEITDCQEKAYRIVTFISRRAANDKAAAYWQEIDKTARGIFTWASLKAKDVNPVHWSQKVEDTKRRTDEIETTLKGEIAEIRKRYDHDPKQVESISREVCELDLAEITRLNVDLTLWLEGHAHTAWTEAVEDLGNLLTRALEVQEGVADMNTEVAA